MQYRVGGGSVFSCSSVRCNSIGKWHRWFDHLLEIGFYVVDCGVLFDWFE